MKILHLNTYDHKGGAARAATRLVKGLVESSVDTNLLVRSKNSTASFIHPAGERFSALKPYFDYLPGLIFLRKRMPFFSACVPDNLLKNIERFKPDILHLNWISEGFVKIETLAKLKIPIVWTLHDFWAFTGGCHLPGKCIKFQTNCETCHYLTPSLRRDLSYFNFKRKQKAYQKIQSLSVVAPSEWLKSQVASSSILREREVHVIPNGLDTTFFRRLGKEQAKKELGIQSEKKIIVFGGVNSISDKNKGYNLFIEALRHLNNKNITILIFGENKVKSDYFNSCEIKHLGKITDDKKLRNIYSIADVTVAPSYVEVFGQVITESMSCGTPVVAFNCSGPAEIIQHKENGYLANAFESKDLATGIDWVLEDFVRWEKLSLNAISFVRNKYSISLVAEKYIKLYKKILGNNL